tara:strand:+ start:1049 stop:1405 length:357 start_codon:yes stop_codon:yes gene_type:complete
MNKLFICLVLMSVGCASTGPAQVNPCKERSFDEWLSYYDLKTKANSTWPEKYGPAFFWLEDVAHACYPERFDHEVEEVEDEPAHSTRCRDLPSADLEPSYIAECDLLVSEPFDEIKMD